MLGGNLGSLLYGDVSVTKCVFDDNYGIILLIDEAILMKTHNIGFYEEMGKIMFQLISSNTHLICSSVAGNTGDSRC